MHILPWLCVATVELRRNYTDAAFFVKMIVSVSKS